MERRYYSVFYVSNQLIEDLLPRLDTTKVHPYTPSLALGAPACKTTFKATFKEFLVTRFTGDFDAES